VKPLLCQHLDRRARDLLLAPIRHEARCVVERDPARLGDLDLHPGRQLADPAALRGEEEERDDLEDSLPVPRVDVAAVAELPLDPGLDACLLEHLADGSLGGALARVDLPLGQRPDLGPVRVATRAHERRPPPAPHTAHDHASGRELASHHANCRCFVTGGDLSHAD
jgi:hypothetical protein